jgi:hypothetical protein
MYLKVFLNLCIAVSLIKGTQIFQFETMPVFLDENAKARLKPTLDSKNNTFLKKI